MSLHLSMGGLQNHLKNGPTDTDVINLKLYGLFVTSTMKFRQSCHS